MELIVTTPYFAKFLWILRNLQTNIVQNLQVDSGKDALLLPLTNQRISTTLFEIRAHHGSKTRKSQSRRMDQIISGQICKEKNGEEKL
jgi:hypothetical protein